MLKIDKFLILTEVPAVWVCLSMALLYSLTMERKKPTDVLSYSLLIPGLCDLCK